MRVCFDAGSLACAGVAELSVTHLGRAAHVKKVSAGKFHTRRGSQGPFWQHQFWDRFVRNEKEFGQRLEYMHFNPIRKGLLKRPQGWRWSSYNNFALDKATVAACPIQIDYVRLPEGYREKSAVRRALTVATRLNRVVSRTRFL